MDSDTQLNPKPNWKSAAFGFLGFTAFLGSITALSKLMNPQTVIFSVLYLGAAFTAAYLLHSLLSIIRLKVITILSLLASVVFLLVSFLIRDHNPKLSSISFLNAFIALAVAIVPTLVSRTQTFLYDRGYRGTGVYIDSPTSGAWCDGSWGDDCSGDGGGGDCGG